MNRPIWKWALIVGLPWTAFMITLKVVISKHNSVFGILVIILAGMAFGLIFGAVIKYLTTKLYNSISIVIPEGENTIKEGPANYSNDRRPGVGGKLVLTNKRLIFKTHNRSSRDVAESLELEKITAWSVNKTGGILKNRITVETIDGPSHVFVLDAPAEWIAGIERQKLASK